MYQNPPSKIQQGVYKRRLKGKVQAIQIDLDRANAARGSAINLMPAQPVPNVNDQEVALVVRIKALERILEDPEVREALEELS